MHHVSANVHQLVVGTGVTAIGDNSAYALGQRQSACKQDGCRTHGNPVQNCAAILFKVTVKPVRPVGAIEPLQRPESNIVAFAFPVCALIDQQNVQSELHVIGQNNSELGQASMRCAVPMHEKNRVCLLYTSNANGSVN